MSFEYLDNSIPRIILIYMHDAVFIRIPRINPIIYLDKFVVTLRHDNSLVFPRKFLIWLRKYAEHRAFSSRGQGCPEFKKVAENARVYVGLEFDEVNFVVGT